MATTRIADLPSATTINDAIYLAIDSYTTEGTCKASPSEIMSILISTEELNTLARLVGVSTQANANVSPQVNASPNNDEGGEGSEER